MFTAVWSRTVCLAGFSLIALACGPGGSGDDDDDDDDGRGDAAPPGSLIVAPGDVTLSVEGGVAATQAYSVTLVGDDGSEQDVSDEAALTLDDPRLGSFGGNVLTTATDAAGRTKVRASARGKTGPADLMVHLTHIIVVGDAPDDAADLFDGAAGDGIAPSIVYPSGGIIVPPNPSRSRRGATTACV